MTIIEIENNLKNLVENFSKETFIFDLLVAYDFKKATIKRLQGSDHDKLDTQGELTIRKKLFFKVPAGDIHLEIDNLKKAPRIIKQNPRFIIVTDYDTLLAYDTKTDDSLDIPLLNITNHYDFFLPWAGMEKSQHQNENPADIKAAVKMAKLYDEILKNNHFETAAEIHALNVFLTRLLFCYFAEDTNIFEDNIFTRSIASHTQADGSDLDSYLSRLFEVFNTEKRSDDIPKYLKSFPYVNGGLFRGNVPLPKFTTKSRNIMIEVGELNWSQINPDIFGSMIQAVITPQHRGGMGMHYTSVPNIMKVIEPLFLDELYEEFERGYDSKIILQNLLKRITNIKIFDPACGSGNFLIIAYKKLRELEMSILKRIDMLSPQRSFAFSEIKLSNFYGIELDDFAHEVAILSLWLVEHQMNLKFYEEFGRNTPSLPLHAGGNVVHGNATRLNWEEVCPKNKGDEIYILGNPPYIGTRNQEKHHKEDIDFVFATFNKRRKLDYIAIWFYLASKYINGINSKYSFVSTNSICQGEQVPILWPLVLSDTINIFFAYQSFNWKNNAKGNAGITVVIIGVSNKKPINKKLFINNISYLVEEINPYLSAAPTIYINALSKPISNLPEMVRGNYTGCCSALILTENEKNELVDSNNKSIKFIKKLVGSSELIKSENRYCLWIDDNDLEEALLIDEIKNRIEKVKIERLNSSDKGQQRLANRSHQFREFNSTKNSSIVVPVVSSIRREYIPSAFITRSEIVPNSAQVIYDCEYWVFGVLNSKIHMKWVDTLAGRLRSDYRYSSSLCWNTFPFPDINEKQKEEIKEHVFNILDERERYPEKTLAQLYDPDKMPSGLKEAHHQLDLAIEKCYRNKQFENDEERLEYLFKLYEKMIKNRGK